MTTMAPMMYRMEYMVCYPQYDVEMEMSVDVARLLVQAQQLQHNDDNDDCADDVQDRIHGKTPCVTGMM